MIFEMSFQSRYDYIIAGMGAAGLSLAVRMIRSGKFSDKSILLIDKDEKKINDRTWCFWETSPGLFDEIVFKKWPSVFFYAPDYLALYHINPYQYKMIRGSDFYQYCLAEIKKQPNFTIRYGKIESVINEGEMAEIQIEGMRIGAKKIFNSIFSKPSLLKGNEYYLLQHFKGWIIETDNAVFNEQEATLMDFRVHQDYGTTFVYVMPFTPNKALVEYTLFTPGLLHAEQYDEGLKNYISTYIHPGGYKILDEEFGIIPMTNYRFPTTDRNITFIGTAGGQTKASSGYTFQFIQKQTQKITEFLIADKPLSSLKTEANRFHFYDSVLLNILYHNKLPGSKIFAALFKHNQPQQVMKFLDNETSLAEELKIISTLPTLPFLKAALQQL
jgi:lycopene beta-cyclase